MATAKNAKTFDNRLRPHFFANSRTNIPRTVPTIASGIRCTYWTDKIPTSEETSPRRDRPEKASLSAASSDSGEKEDSWVAMEAQDDLKRMPSTPRLTCCLYAILPDSVRSGNRRFELATFPLFSSFCAEEILLLEKATLTPDTIPNKMQVLSRTA